MKTRILTTALMILFTTVLIAGPVSNTDEDSLSAPRLAVLSGTTGSETVDYGTQSEYFTNEAILENTAGLENWVESREIWESEASDLAVGFGLETVNLDGWFDSRENWERESTEMPSFTGAAASLKLDEWVVNRESWEQEPAALDLSGMAYLNNIEEWVSECENWEQSGAAGEEVIFGEGSLQQEWINNRAMWEQK